MMHLYKCNQGRNEHEHLRQATTLFGDGRRSQILFH
jgi:hypothetical protein